MKPKFKMPQTRKVKVVYARSNGGLVYTILDNPRTNDALLMAMLAKGIGFSQLRSVQSVTDYAQRCD